MSGWAADDTNNAEWRDYAAQLRGELPEPHKNLRYRVWHLSLTLAVSIVYVIFFVGVPFIRLLQTDGVLR